MLLGLGFDTSCVTRKPVFGVFNQVPDQQGCKTSKIARGLKFLIKEVEGLYQCSENKGAVWLPCS